MKVKNADIIYYMLTKLVYLQQKNLKKSKKLLKIVIIEEENLNIYQTTWGLSMKFSGKIKIENNKKPGLYHLSRKYSFGKTTGRFPPPPLPSPPSVFRVNYKLFIYCTNTAINIISGPSPNTKKLFLQLSVWDDELSSI